MLQPNAQHILILSQVADALVYHKKITSSLQNESILLSDFFAIDF